LDSVDKTILQKHDVDLIVLTPAPVWAVQRFVDEINFKLPIYSDPTKSLYKALNMNLKFDSKLEWRVASKHVRTSVPVAWIKGFYKGVTEGLQGDPRQQGGTFILGPAQECSFVHYDAFNADHVAIPALLEAAGLPSLAFQFRSQDTHQ